MQGIVVKTHNRYYQVRIGTKTYLCNPKGHFKRSKDADYRLPVIGDRVAIVLKKNRGIDGYIDEILPRENQLSRQIGEGWAGKQRIMAANLDRIVVVSALVNPGIDFHLVDRYIVAATLSRIPVTLVVNKIDLTCETDHGLYLELYGYLGYPFVETSVDTGQGIAQLRELTAQGISFFTGSSGVGKSSLINQLIPQADLTTGAVDERKGQGRHTTTNSVLLPLGESGYLVDSPGLRDFAPPAMPPEDVRFGFSEIVEVQPHCKYSSCLHEQEPGCAVMAAVDEGDITDIRYKSYLLLLDEMKQLKENKYR